MMKLRTLLKMATCLSLVMVTAWLAPDRLSAADDLRLGVVVGPGHYFGTDVQVDDFASELQQKLGAPVGWQGYSSEAVLYEATGHYGVVGLAYLDQRFLDRLPGRGVLTVASVRDATGAAVGEFVVGPKMETAQIRALQKALDRFARISSRSVRSQEVVEIRSAAPVVAAPVVEEPVVKAPVAEAPVVEEPVAEAPVVAAPVVEAPVVEAPVVEEPVVAAPIVEAPIVEAPVVEAPVVEAPVVAAPVVTKPRPVRTQAPQQAQDTTQAKLFFGMSPATVDERQSDATFDAFQKYLSRELGRPVSFRFLSDEEQLLVWMRRFRQVDLAFVSESAVDQLPAGSVHRLALYEGSEGERVWAIARDGMTSSLVQEAGVVFERMKEQPAGQELLVSLSLLSGGHAESVVAPSAPVATPPAESSPVVPKKTAPEVEATPAQPDVASETLPAEVPSVPNEEVAALPETDSQGELPISISADSLAYNKQDETYEASGSVMIRRGETTLSAEDILWQTTTQDVAAEGGVTLEEAQGQTRADAMTYNMATGKGHAANAKVLIRDRNFRLAGEDIEKTGDATFQVKAGSFTTCDGEIPDWKFSAEEVDVTLGRYAEARDVWFHLKDVPVLYIPYVVFPVKSERESGLLMPRFGYSRNQGAKISLAWYQVIDRHMDATLYLDYLSRLGVGKGLEYRYFLGDDSTGQALYYHVSGISETPDMYAIDWEHGGTLPGDVWLAADVQYVDDVTFFEEFGEVAEEYNRDKTVSTIWAQRNWQKLNLSGQARYIKDYESDNDETLQKLPELSLSLPRYRLGDTPLYARVESYGTNFWREEGEDGQRLYLRTGVAAALKPGSWLEITPEIALYERLYHVDSGDDEIAVPEYSISVGTRLQRVFEVDRWGIEKLLHSIEPLVTYTYIPESSQKDLPLFDLKDRILKENLIEYALINRLTARTVRANGEADYRELLNLRLSQSYDVDEARDDDLPKKEPFSDLRVELELRPTEQTRLKVDSRIAVHGDLEFTRIKANAGFDDDAGNEISLNYNYRDQLNEDARSEYLGLTLGTSLFKPFYLHFEERYDFSENRELEKVFGLEYRSKCWSLFLTFRDRLDDQEILLSFALAGLSESEGFGGDMNRRDD